MSFIRKVRILLWKEIRSELQSKEMLSTMIVFSLLVVVVFGFAIDLNKELMSKVLPGIIWITIIFAGIFCLNRSFAAEKQNDCLYGLMLCPLDRSAIYVAKTIMNLLLMVIVEGVTVPLFFIIFNYPGPQQLGLFVIVLLLGTYCFMAVGTFLAALSSATKAGEMLMPIMLIPLIVPVLLSAVIVTKDSFGLVGSGTDLFLKILVVYGVVFTVLPMLLFDYLLEV
ncbi:heme exporter protein CcmB [Desulfosporosinus sp. BICA1-9]|uniref:heme exporter protein CcmB n=1 Tax=Desulfosporosinus sp. BICA1-9 TaxID=1531958 RepID=UPI00054BCCD7|nr:heme exporter protein CcmB [Desulfosporosinus sp. BICA1-9]KJS50703.1 MAG: transcriptional regulator [Peptococcaceae bacterium BRH_c23]KJS82088.1 MAG: transcriptional regulator [Desulfosporosinus sp. BICA1-9]HBV85338.1 transcriptional regulator [Desulfosporosinus sp.]